mmetsp:Transcript_14832/g.29244  ORF Transcript_14832/g.29244 Transcript_14832/m.29244 type:complete len:134 (-) Transcript_14832:56-457(-)|eukprot:CAMPEP_0172882642 /NCGR_PEP_ID=MMETSP1075-20121228/120609_1 /TAXON_ID=2916 /ORGANISM="Ceratium fusus, Strain PA161109" /LENGTH=133 /DNA_ID=CAMNT_0013735349 /DNA_START=60 /DNA_END=461 /DNA_ORIENTATION=-
MVGYFASPDYQKNCLLSPMLPSLIWGSGFAALSAAQGMPFSMHLVANNVGLLYVYQALQCPMEALHGRRSLLHNMTAGGLMGYWGVQAGRIGIPFLDASFFMRYPGISPPIAGFVVYGGFAAVLGGVVGGKSL